MPGDLVRPKCYQAILFRDGALSGNVFRGALSMSGPVHSRFGCRECVGRTPGAPSQTQTRYSPRSQGTRGTRNPTEITTAIYRFTTARGGQGASSWCQDIQFAEAKSAAFRGKQMSQTSYTPGSFTIPYGGGTGTRTPNPLLAKQVRYQLRHAPIRSNPSIIP
ncbi:MAG: hypothetical protein JWM13_691 [Arthrobacter sp.]|nr:hypothetical protein [Arthrobacter sp.]